MSKTRGNVLDPFAVMERYGIDPLRYYLLREVAFGQDGVISMDGFESRYNNELANELGNLVSRVVSIIGKYRGGSIPAWPSAEMLPEVLAEGEAMVRATAAHFEAVEITAAVESIWEHVRRLNRLVEEEAPWKLAKDASQAERLDTVLHSLAAGLRHVALAVYPVVPGTAVEILRRLGQAHDTADLLLEHAVWSGLAAAAVETAPPLFPRIEADAEARRFPLPPRDAGRRRQRGRRGSGCRSRERRGDRYRCGHLTARGRVRGPSSRRVCDCRIAPPRCWCVRGGGAR